MHDLRMPWRGRPFVGRCATTSRRCPTRASGARSRTPRCSRSPRVVLELVLGLVLALCCTAVAARGLVRTLALLPWAMPTVVAALLWRFLFEPWRGVRLSSIAARRGAARASPIVLADVWKTTPFVALLLLAGLQASTRRSTKRRSIDGASAWQQLVAHHAAAACGRRCWSRCSSARSTRFACSTCLRADRRRPGHRDRAARAARVRHAAAQPALRSTARRSSIVIFAITLPGSRVARTRALLGEARTSR